MATPSGYVPALAYDWLTPAYDVVVRWTTRERRFKQALLEQAQLAAGQRVLDLACGTATLTILAKQAVPGIDIAGLDGDPAILARARAKADKAGVAIRFDQGLSTALPYADASFDRVLCSLFFHHLEAAAKRRSFAELARVLKPGGELHVADWGAAANPAMRLAFLGIQLLDGFANTADNVRGLLPGMMREAGLREVHERQRFSTMWGTLSLYSAQR
ncbi:MAG TPA: class I SAM-dependent methyltransferase [Solimonas sp.]|nr:class I SAM-dependent methyltransferase [Solimonas sp.]